MPSVMQRVARETPGAVRAQPATWETRETQRRIAAAPDMGRA